VTRRAWPALLACMLTACVSFDRVQVDEPITDAQLAALQPGQSTLQQCLAQLGAPVEVFAYRGDGMALLWVWQDTAGFGLEVSSPFGGWSDAAQFDLDLTDRTLPGWVLWFDGDLRLQRLRRASLGELLPRRVRAPTDDG